MAEKCSGKEDSEFRLSRFKNWFLPITNQATWRKPSYSTWACFCKIQTMIVSISTAKSIYPYLISINSQHMVALTLFNHSFRWWIFAESTMSSTRVSLLWTKHPQLLTLISFASLTAAALFVRHSRLLLSPPAGMVQLDLSLESGWNNESVCANTFLNSQCCTLTMQPDNASGFGRVTTITTAVVSGSKFCPTLLPPHGLHIAHQVPLSVGFPRQEYWSGLSFPSPEDLPNPGIKPTSFALAGRCFTTEPLGKPMTIVTELLIYMSETMPSLWHILTNSLHTLTLGGRNYYPHFS